MKKTLLISACLLLATSAFCQIEINKANECYDAKDYQCATDNYLLAIERKSYKPEQKYLVEYRIGAGNRILKQDDKAKEYLLKSIASNSSYLYSYWDLGHLYVEKQDYLNARSNYLKAINLAESQNEKDHINWSLADANYRLKNYPLALPYLRKIDSREGKFYRTEAFLGDVFYANKQYDSAIYYYTKSEKFYKQVDSSLKLVKYYEGQAYKELREYDKALEAYDASLKIAPDYSYALWGKGIVYASKKDYLKAIEQYKKTIASHEKSKADMYVLTGNIAACYKNLDNLVEYINWETKKKNYSANPFLEYYRVAAIQYGGLNKQKESLKTCEDAIKEYQSASPEILQSLPKDEYAKILALAGKIYLEKKDTVAALSMFDESLKLSKGNFVANAGAGDVAWQRKNQAAFRNYYTNIYKTIYDTLVTSNEELAQVYGRNAYVDANINKTTSYNSNMLIALKYDSLQKEALLLWPTYLLSSKYNLDKYRTGCIALLNKGIKKYIADKNYTSDLYNAKAALLLPEDSVEMERALEEALKLNPVNMGAWDNTFKYYGRFDNEKGVKKADKLIEILKNKKDNKTTADAYVYKGDFLWRAGKKELAKEAWQEALVWDSQNASAKQRVKL